MRAPGCSEQQWGHVTSCPTLHGEAGTVCVDFSGSGGVSNATYQSVHHLSSGPVPNGTFQYKCPAAPEGPIGRWHYVDGKDYFRIYQHFDVKDGKYKLCMKDACLVGEPVGILVSAAHLDRPETRCQKPEGWEAHWACEFHDGSVHWLRFEGTAITTLYCKPDRRSQTVVSRKLRAELVPFDCGDRVTPRRSLVKFAVEHPGRYEVQDGRRWVHAVLAGRNPDGTYQARLGTQQVVDDRVEADRIRRLPGLISTIDDAELEFHVRDNTVHDLMRVQVYLSSDPDFKKKSEFILEDRECRSIRTMVWVKRFRDLPCTEAGVAYVRVKVSKVWTLKSNKKVSDRVYTLRPQSERRAKLVPLDDSTADQRVTVHAAYVSPEHRNGADWKLSAGQEGFVCNVRDGSICVRDLNGTSEWFPATEFDLVRCGGGGARAGEDDMTGKVIADGTCHAVVEWERGVAKDAAELAVAGAVAYCPAHEAGSPRRRRGERVWISAYDPEEQLLTVRWADGHSACVKSVDLCRALPCDAPAEPYRSGSSRRGSRFCHTHRCANAYCGEERQHWKDGNRYCVECSCSMRSCNQKRLNKEAKFCRDHKCISAGCNSQRESVLFCKLHDAVRLRGATGGDYLGYDLRAVSPQLGVRGLLNDCARRDDMSNVCYMNSVLQCLSATPGLSHVIRSLPSNPSVTSIDSWQGSILQAVSLTLGRLWEKEGKGYPRPRTSRTGERVYCADVLRARGLREASCLYSGTNGDFGEFGQQQCALEYWCFLREWMQRSFFPMMTDPQACRERRTLRWGAREWRQEEYLWQGDERVLLRHDGGQYAVVKVEDGDALPETVAEVVRAADSAARRGGVVAVDVAPDRSVPEDADAARVLALGTTAYDNFRRHNDSPIVHCFAHSAITGLQCAGCGAVSWCGQWDISQESKALYLPTTQESVNLQDMIKRHGTFDCPDPRTGPCKKCDQEQQWWPTSLWQRLPEILVLYPQRVVTEEWKLNNDVRFPVKGLDVSPLLQAGSPAALYDLYAVVCHNGHAPRSGHYTAYTQNQENGNWYLFDDQCGVVPWRESDLQSLGRSCYLLFYRRQVPEVLVVQGGAPGNQGTYRRAVHLAPKGMAMWSRAGHDAPRRHIVSSDDGRWCIVDDVSRPLVTSRRHCFASPDRTDWRDGVTVSRLPQDDEPQRTDAPDRTPERGCDALSAGSASPPRGDPLVEASATHLSPPRSDPPVATVDQSAMESEVVAMRDDELRAEVRKMGYHTPLSRPDMAALVMEFRTDLSELRVGQVTFIEVESEKVVVFRAHPEGGLMYTLDGRTDPTRHFRKADFKQEGETTKLVVDPGPYLRRIVLPNPNEHIRRRLRMMFGTHGVGCLDPL
eukprot:TRINITY_DN46822_c0_g1_i1.p1 TRINITY_DN46822_c0_g1~~TRINITY_DN46822_c0_g1_i1.p1  ORF type:complete len:1364 (+),score=250.14 TRINITY_DN46822_c0_g1_i1:323-4414(+)